MASRNGYCCDICNIVLPYKSKFEQHLTTKKHLVFANIMEKLSNATSSNQLEPHLTNEDTTDVDLFEQAEPNLEREPEAPNLDEPDLEALAEPEAPDTMNNYSTESDYSDSDINSSDSEYEDNMLNMLVESQNLADEELNYSPFPNKLFALLYLLFHCPRPIGETNLKFIFFTLSQIGCETPSFNSVKKFDLPNYIPPIKFTTQSGIPFYYNSIGATLRMCLSNPEIAKSLHHYPVLPEQECKEIYHGERWRNDKRFLAPMCMLPSGCRVFVRDCIQFSHPRFGLTQGVVLKFMYEEKRNSLMALVDMLLSPCTFSNLTKKRLMCPDGTFIKFGQCTIPVSCIVSNNVEVHHIFIWDMNESVVKRMKNEECKAYLQPHPLKSTSGSKPILLVPIILYTDDTSGNISKKWHAFNNWCFLLAGLPRHMNSNLQHIHFICCSDKATVIDMSEPIVSEIQVLETTGICCYNGFLMCDVLILVRLMCITCDNPRASELLNHLGASANKFCRMCMADKHVNATTVCHLRTLEDTRFILSEIKKQPTERQRAEMCTQYGIREAHNPLLTLPLDLFQSIPVETLHTVLLGPFKYLLKRQMSVLSVSQKNEICARILAFDQSGMPFKLRGNICRYYGSMLGRDYKAWAQMCLFIIWPYLSDGEKKVWLSLMKIFRMTYCSFYNPASEAQYRQICHNFVDAIRDHMPEMLQKPKIHLMLHIVDNMKDFGPTSAYNTERCESFNGLMRKNNVFGNKQAPSRDVAISFAKMEAIRFVCSGGYSSNGQCGGNGLVALWKVPSVQTFFNCVPYHSLLAYKTIYHPGTLRLEKGIPAHSFDQSIITLSGIGDVTINNLSTSNIQYDNALKIPDTILVREYNAVMDQQQNLVHLGNAVKIEGFGYGVLTGCYVTLKNELEVSFCLLRPLAKLAEQEILNEFDCPLLTMEDRVSVVPASKIGHLVNIVHECTTSCAFEVYSQHQMIEREKASKMTLAYRHDHSNKIFSLNIYAMKNLM